MAEQFDLHDETCDFAEDDKLVCVRTGKDFVQSNGGTAGTNSYDRLMSGTPLRQSVGISNSICWLGGPMSPSRCA